jgi:hypothetical protein
MELRVRGAGTLRRPKRGPSGPASRAVSGNSDLMWS